MPRASIIENSDTDSTARASRRAELRATAATMNAPAAATSAVAPLAFSVDGAVAALNGAVCRTKLFALLKSGDIPSFKVGRRRLIPADALHGFLARQRGNAA
jgi:excisionase family DNA binding protein